MKQLGLIGYPLSHSFSEAYFKRKFSAESITGWSYKLFPMKKLDNLRAFISERNELVGLNVTIPHKINVLPHLDTVSSEAKEIGAVNTIKIIRGNNNISLQGYNTDVYGFRKSLIDFLAGTKPMALVLGSGGAARAVAYVLNELNIKYRIVSRTPEKLMYSYQQIDSAIIKDYQLIINTTPLGMYPYESAFPDILYENLTPKHFLFDLIYNPEETLFLKKGKESGAAVKNGSEMLYLQAEKAWEIWISDYRSRVTVPW